MPRFSLPISFVAIAALLWTSVAFGQAPASSAGIAPAPASPPANAPSGAGPTRPTGPIIDRGSLLEPTPSTKSGVVAQPAPATAAEGRENERRTDATIGANP